MSVRYEGAAAKDATPNVLSAGAEIGEDVVPEGQFALCFDYDEVFYLQGTEQELVHLLATALARLSTASVRQAGRAGEPTP